MPDDFMAPIRDQLDRVFLRGLRESGELEGVRGRTRTQLIADVAGGFDPGIGAVVFTPDGAYERDDAHSLSSLPGWRAWRGAAANPYQFGATRGRASAAANRAALQAMFDHCAATGQEFDLLGGTWFVSGQGLVIDAPVRGRGLGTGYWHAYAAAFDNGVNQPAQTQIVFVGTGTKTLSVHGITSNRPLK